MFSKSRGRTHGKNGPGQTVQLLQRCKINIRMDIKPTQRQRTHIRSTAQKVWMNKADWQPIGNRIGLWEIDWYQNEWPWLLFRNKVVSRSRQPLRYIGRWISRKPLEIEACFQRTTNRKWHKLWGIKWSRDPWRYVTPKGQTLDPNTLRAQYLENCWSGDAIL